MEYNLTKGNTEKDSHGLCEHMSELCVFTRSSNEVKPTKTQAWCYSGLKNHSLLDPTFAKHCSSISGGVGGGLDGGEGLLVHHFPGETQQTG